jgi:hypothetical protein
LFHKPAPFNIAQPVKGMVHHRYNEIGFADLGGFAGRHEIAADLKD